jgi:hypothetical protein
MADGRRGKQLHQCLPPISSVFETPLHLGPRPAVWYERRFLANDLGEPGPGPGMFDQDGGEEFN